MTTTRSARIKFKNGFDGTMQLVWEHDKLNWEKYSRRQDLFFHYSDLGTRQLGQQVFGFKTTPTIEIQCVWEPDKQKCVKYSVRKMSCFMNLFIDRQYEQQVGNHNAVKFAENVSRIRV